MRSFKDLAGRDWQLSITVGTIRGVREQFDGLNLLDLGAENSGGINRIFGDLELFVDLLEFLTRKQAAELGITAADFGESLAGDVLLDAQNAFLEALCDFFPNPGRRQMLRAAISRAREAEELLIERGLLEVERMSLESLTEISTPSAGSSPAKSESPPKHLASANSAG